MCDNANFSEDDFWRVQQIRHHYVKRTHRRRKKQFSTFKDPNDGQYYFSQEQKEPLEKLQKRRDEIRKQSEKQLATEEENIQRNASHIVSDQSLVDGEYKNGQVTQCNDNVFGMCQESTEQLKRIQDQIFSDVPTDNQIDKQNGDQVTEINHFLDQQEIKQSKTIHNKNERQTKENTTIINSNLQQQLYIDPSQNGIASGLQYTNFDIVSQTQNIDVPPNDDAQQTLMENTHVLGQKSTTFKETQNMKHSPISKNENINQIQKSYDTMIAQKDLQLNQMEIQLEIIIYKYNEVVKENKSLTNVLTQIENEMGSEQISRWSQSSTSTGSRSSTETSSQPSDSRATESREQFLAKEDLSSISHILALAQDIQNQQVYLIQEHTKFCKIKNYSKQLLEIAKENRNDIQELKEQLIYDHNVNSNQQAGDLVKVDQQDESFNTIVDLDNCKGSENIIYNNDSGQNCLNDDKVDVRNKSGNESIVRVKYTMGNSQSESDIIYCPSNLQYNGKSPPIEGTITGLADNLPMDSKCGQNKLDDERSIIISISPQQENSSNNTELITTNIGVKESSGNDRAKENEGLQEDKRCIEFLNKDLIFCITEALKLLQADQELCTFFMNSSQYVDSSTATENPIGYNSEIASHDTPTHQGNHPGQCRGTYLLLKLTLILSNKNMYIKKLIVKCDAAEQREIQLMKDFDQLKNQYISEKQQLQHDNELLQQLVIQEPKQKKLAESERDLIQQKLNEVEEKLEFQQRNLVEQNENLVELKSAQEQRIQQEYDILQTKYVNLQQSFDTAQENLRENQVIIIDLKSQLFTQLESQKEFDQTVLKKQTKTQQDLQEKNDMTEQQKIELNQLTIERDELKEKLYSVQNQLNGQNSQMKDNVENVDKLSQVISELQQENTQLNTWYTNCSDKLYESEKYIKSLEEEHDQHQKDNQTEIHELQLQIADEKSLITQQEYQIKHANQQVAEIEQHRQITVLENDNTNQENIKLKQQVQSLTETNHQLLNIQQQIKNKYHADNLTAEEECAQLKQYNKTNEYEVSNLNKQKDLLKDNIRENAQLYQDLTVEHESAIQEKRNKIKELEEHIMEDGEQYRKLSTQNDILRSDLDSFQHKIDSLINETSDLQQSANAKDQEVEQLRLKLEQSVNDNQELQCANEFLQQDMQTIDQSTIAQDRAVKEKLFELEDQRQLREVYHENIEKEYQQEVVKMKQTIDDLSNERKLLEDEVERQTYEITQFTTYEKQYQANEIQFQQYNQQLLSQLKTSIDDLDVLQRDKTTLVTNYEETKGRMQELLKDNESLKQQSSSIQKEYLDHVQKNKILIDIIEKDYELFQEMIISQQRPIMPISSLINNSLNEDDNQRLNSIRLQLQESIQKLIELNTSLVTENRLLSLSQQQVEEQNLNIAQEMSELNNELQKEKRQTTILRNEIETLQSELQSAEEENGKISNAQKTVSVNYEKQMQYLRKLETDHKQMMSNQEQLKELIVKYESQLLSKQNDIGQQQWLQREDNAKLGKQVEQLEIEKKHLMQEAQHLLQQCEEMEEENNQLELKYSICAKKLVTKLLPSQDEEQIELQKQILGKKDITTEEILITLRDQVSYLLQKHIELQQNFQESNRKIQIKDNDIQKIKKQLQKMSDQTNTDTQEMQINTNQGAMSELRSEIKRLRSENFALIETTQLYENSISNKQDEYQELYQDRQNLLEKIKISEVKIENLQQIINQQNCSDKEITDSRNLYDKLEEDYQDLQHNYKLLHLDYVQKVKQFKQSEDLLSLQQQQCKDDLTQRMHELASGNDEQLAQMDRYVKELEDNYADLEQKYQKIFVLHGYCKENDGTNKEKENEYKLQLYEIKRHLNLTERKLEERNNEIQELRQLLKALDNREIVQLAPKFRSVKQINPKDFLKLGQQGKTVSREQDLYGNNIQMNNSQFQQNERNKCHIQGPVKRIQCPVSCQKQAGHVHGLADSLCQLGCVSTERRSSCLHCTMSVHDCSQDGSTQCSLNYCTSENTDDLTNEHQQLQDEEYDDRGRSSDTPGGGSGQGQTFLPTVNMMRMSENGTNEEDQSNFPPIEQCQTSISKQHSAFLQTEHEANENVEDVEWQIKCLSMLSKIKDDIVRTALQQQYQED